MVRLSKFHHMVLLAAFLLTMLFPTGVAFAEEAPPTDTPTEEAAPAEETPADEAPAEEAVATEESAAEETVTEEATEAVATEESTDGEEVADVVEVLSETDSVVLSEEGEVLPLASEEAEDVLSGSDPYFDDGTGQIVGYSATGVCPAIVDVCNTSATPVQAAVDAAPVGAVIYLEPGTYTEQVVINKNLTLQGTGDGVIIKSPTVLTASFNNGPNNKPVIYVNNTDNVVIDGITVDGDNKGDANYRFVGIGYYNAGGTIQNNTIVNVMNSTFSGAQHGVGIYAYNTGATAYNLIVFNNEVYDYQKTGIALNGSNLTVDVSGNTVTGAGPTGVTAQNGIQLYGTGGSISNNTVTGNYYTGPNWAASGLLIWAADGTVQIHDNTVTDNQVNLYNYDSNVNNSGNVFSGGEYGIVISGSGAGNANGTITGDDINNNNVGVYTDNPATVINLNNIVGNGVGVEYDDYYAQGGTVNAENNYWGCPNGPDDPTCDQVAGDVDYTPWSEVPFPLVEPAPDVDAPAYTTSFPEGALPAGVTASFSTVSGGSLPGSLPAGSSMIGTGVTISFTDAGGGRYTGSVGTFTLGLKLPAGFSIPDGYMLVMMYYHPIAGWQIIPVTVVGNMVYADVSAAGTYILALVPIG